jgi:branched-chain amino acid transport system ATP-binding protein
MLELKNLSAGYDDLVVLRDVNLEVEKGEKVAVIGPNGAGKSTLLKSIVRSVDVKAGYVTYQGEDITSLSSHDRVRKGISLVPEGRKLFPKMTVLENLQVASYGVGMNREDYQKHLDQVFSIFPRLEERLSQKARTLSGGEQQMVAIARGLMCNPQLLLLDEPSLGLAPKLIDEVYQVLEKLIAAGLTILIVEQHVFRVLNLADRAYLLERGQITREGVAQDLLKDPSVRKAYIG